MVFFLYRVGIFIALNTPLKIAYRISCFVSTLYRLISIEDNRALSENIRVIFPDIDKKSLENIKNAIFANFGKYLVDFFRFSLIDKGYIDKYVKIEGRHFLDNALTRGKGVIMSSAHLGNYELGGLVLSAMGIPIDVVALKHRHEKVDVFFTQQRLKKGIGVIPVGTAVRRCFKSLNQNRAVALVCDRDYFDNGYPVFFFNKKTIIPKGPAIFSRRHNCPIVPVFMVRNQDDTFTLKILKPIEPVITDNEQADLMDITKRVIIVIEQMIKEYPQQWFVFKRFWEKMGRGKVV
jgi:Kdo2-lipid IVA lauroyltransferase/acyltransferase